MMKNRREGRKVARLSETLILMVNEGKGEKDRDREKRERDIERVGKKVTEKEERRKEKKKAEREIEEGCVHTHGDREM